MYIIDLQYINKVLCFRRLCNALIINALSPQRVNIQ